MSEKQKHDNHAKFKNDEVKEEDWLDERRRQDDRKRDYNDY